MRRIIKPFIVEVRSTGRAANVGERLVFAASVKAKSVRAHTPVADQDWAPSPGTSPARVMPGRVLPSLEESRSPVQLARPDGEMSVDDQMDAGCIEEALPDGGVPADQPQADEAAKATPVDVGVQARKKRSRKPNPAEFADEPADDVKEEPAVAKTGLIEAPGPRRLARDKFPRGERWKARLPLAAHRLDGKRNKILSR